MTKGRIEAFSDGVIAIIITIMVLELKVPHGEGPEVLIPLIPIFLSYVLSFANVGIYWNNHHHMFHAVKHVGGWVLWANLNLLFWLSLMPFATGFMGENHFAPVTVFVYTLDLLMCAVSYLLLELALITQHGRDSDFARALNKGVKDKASFAIYLLALIVSIFQPVLALVMVAGVAALWVVPDRRFTAGGGTVTPITCIEDLAALHRARVPRMFWDYCESGSYTEQTFRDNESDFAQIRLRQRVARDLSGRSTAMTMLGRPVAMPVALAPVGSCGMQAADGEIKAALAARDFGVPFTLSTFSICSIEDVAKATGAPFWFQLYVMKDEDFVDGLIARARAAGCDALVITLDLQVLGQRHKDIKNGLTAPPRMTPRNLWDMAMHPRWSLGMLGTRRRTFRNVVGHARGVTSLRALNDWSNTNYDPHLDWAKVRKLRDKWGGKVILKGILDPDDARAALDVGADAILVSNHGGRQLDGALSTIRALPAIVAAVEGRAQVFLDGGIRSGQDVLKALALGADGTFIGRSYLHGLGAMGQRGVTTALDVIRREMDTTLALCGQREAAAFGREHVLVPEGFSGRWE